jgi:hypothetical protein
MRKSILLQILIFGLLITSFSGCSPNSAFNPTTTPPPNLTPPALPTFTQTLFFTQTPSFTQTPFQTPSPISASIPYKRVPLNEFIPGLIFQFPITIEIPEDYDMFTAPSAFRTYFWMPQKYGEIFQASETKPRDTNFFQAKLSLNVGYDAATDRFIGAPNDVNDREAISALEDQGIKVNRVERKSIGEYPILIMEMEAPYADTTRKMNIVYFATLVETNVLWITYYFALPENPSIDNAIWEHFELSLERIP